MPPNSQTPIAKRHTSQGVLCTDMRQRHRKLFTQGHGQALNAFTVKFLLLAESQAAESHLSVSQVFIKALQKNDLSCAGVSALPDACCLVDTERGLRVAENI